MISIDYDLVVPDFSTEEIGYGALVRSHDAKVKLIVTNDAEVILLGLSVRPVMEAYVGQEKPQLFQWSVAQVIQEIAPKGTVALEFTFLPVFLGLVSVAFYMTDAASKAVMAKRQADSNYEQIPIRYWFHVADNISVETLRALRILAAASGGKTKK
jgi:hypothetical protein